MQGYRQTARALTRKVKQLREAGAEKVFRETASGARSDRAQLRRVLDHLDKGDVLMVTRLDRLARSTRDLLNTLAAITGKKAGFKSLGDTWADTTTAQRLAVLATDFRHRGGFSTGIAILQLFLVEAAKRPAAACFRCSRFEDFFGRQKQRRSN